MTLRALSNEDSSRPKGASRSSRAVCRRAMVASTAIMGPIVGMPGGGRTARSCMSGGAQGQATRAGADAAASHRSEFEQGLHAQVLVGLEVLVDVTRHLLATLGVGKVRSRLEVLPFLARGSQAALPVGPFVVGLGQALRRGLAIAGDPLGVNGSRVLARRHLGHRLARVGWRGQA